MKKALLALIAVLIFTDPVIAKARNPWVEMTSQVLRPIYTGVPTIPIVTFSLPTGSVFHFLSPTGNDAADGLTPATAWLTPNHAMKCGEVIIAAAGAYNNAGNIFNNWGTNSNCPSISGGIDGLGGIQMAVLLCGGTHVEDCSINCATAPCNGDPAFGVAAGMSINNSNWAVEGWLINGNGIKSYTALQSIGCGKTTVHTAFINIIVVNGGQGFTTSACGSNPGDNFGPDYTSVVGIIAQNSANEDGSICVAAIDFVAPGRSNNTTTDTHFFSYTNYAYANSSLDCAPVSDTENFMLDTIDFNGVPGHIPIVNNVGFFADRACIQLTYQANHTDATTVDIYNNTCYDNYQRNTIPACAGGVCAGPEIAFGDSTWKVNIFDNVVYAPHAINGTAGSDPVYALQNGGQPGNNTKIGAQVGTGKENILKASATTCLAACDSGSAPFNANAYNGATLGTNTYINPDFKNTTDLIANHLGVPNCSSFASTTQCMGWDPITQTMTSLSILDDLTTNATGNCPQCAGKGFQLPSKTCVTSGQLFNDYPPDLKGLVRLQWNPGSQTITQVADLATRPCGM